MPKKKKRKLTKAEKEEAEAKKYRLTEEEAEAFKEVGDMRGWCSFRPRGRPKTTEEEEKEEDPPPAVAVAEDATVSSMSTSSSKRKVVSWGSCEGNFLSLREAVQYAAKELQHLNKLTELFEELEDHFWGNLDETCLMGNEGAVKVIASAEKRKIKKIVDHSRISITAVRVGFASGTQGPIFFLAKGELEAP